jgi:uncharacterized protein (DUF1684 family)
MRTEPVDYLGLADWRRQVAELYAEVRRLAAGDPRAAWDTWRAERERLYREHPLSPLPAEVRAGFRALHFPYDPALRFTLSVQRENLGGEGVPAGANVPNSVGGVVAVLYAGWVEAPFPSGTRRLAVFWLPDYAGGLFLPFRDGTNGAETYGGGRYLLDGAKSADLGSDWRRGTLMIDFNFAYHPSCAFDARWECPLVPPENRIDLPIRAGERLQ